MVYAVGVGMDWRRDLTLAGLRAIKDSKGVFYFSELIGFEEWLRANEIPAHNLSSGAVFGELRASMYRRVADLVVAEARISPPVVWATQGSPALLCGVTAALRTAVPRAGMNLEIITAPTAIDGVMTEIFKKGERIAGLQILDANKMLVHSLCPDPRIPCVIVQLFNAETLLNAFSCRLKSSALTRIQALLERAYSGEHLCCLVSLPRTDNMRVEWDPVPLKDLASVAGRITPWTSLFVTPASTFDTSPGAQLEMESTERLEELYVTPIQHFLNQSH